MNIERKDCDVKTKLPSSIDKAKKHLDYKPQMKFDDDIEKVHEWFVENRDDIKRSS